MVGLIIFIAIAFLVTFTGLTAVYFGIGTIIEEGTANERHSHRRDKGVLERVLGWLRGARPFRYNRGGHRFQTS